MECHTDVCRSDPAMSHIHDGETVIHCPGSARCWTGNYQQLIRKTVTLSGRQSCLVFMIGFEKRDHLEQNVNF